MLRNKKLTYPLLVIVLFIWGKVIYDFVGVQGTDVASPDPVLAEPMVKRVEPDTSFELLLDYDDPFLGSSRPDPRVVRPASISTGRPSSKRGDDKKTNWPRLTYRGVIKNNENEQELAVMEIDDRSYFMTPREEVVGLILVTLHPDSVLLRMGQEEMVVNRNN